MHIPEITLPTFWLVSFQSFFLLQMVTMIQFPVKSDNHAFLLLCNFPRWLAYCYSFRGNVFNSPSQTSVQYSRWCLSDIKKG